jgi:hypothetical protein
MSNFRFSFPARNFKAPASVFPSRQGNMNVELPFFSAALPKTEDFAPILKCVWRNGNASFRFSFPARKSEYRASISPSRQGNMNVELPIGLAGKEVERLACDRLAGKGI